MNLLRASVIALWCAVPALAIAQWQWIDKDGRKVFSDRSPPGDIPAKNILRQPGGARSGGAAPIEAAVDTTAAASQPASPPKPAASAPKLSGKDSELEAKKKQKDAAEAEAKKAKEEEIAKKRAENCARAKSTKATLDSGTRLTRTNAKGEQEILDDAARAVEVKRTDAAIASECKPAGG